MTTESETPAAALDRVAEELALDAEAVHARVDERLRDPLYWFPVRHHSPMTAKHLEAAIRERRPKLIFIEGPSEAQDLVEFLIDRETKPPVAIYSSYRDDENTLGLAGVVTASRSIPARFACWYPLVEYSPEYVAMKAARQIGAEAIFIDLPHFALLRPHSEACDEASPPGAAPTKTPDDDRLLWESGFYRTLAEAAGYRSFNEAWDAIFEFGPLESDREAFRRELATFCAASRATTHPQRIAHDGTLERERCMWQTIQRTLAERSCPPEQAMVVCGGFHLFLDRTDSTPPPSAPAGTVYTSVVPYSFFRISELSGYAAGNRAPQFYQMRWDSFHGAPDDLITEYLITVLKRIRRRGEAASSADAISAYQHAILLAGLRGRPAPILEDLHDALITCCVKGDPQQEGEALLQAIDEVDVGTKVGRVTPRLGRLPLVTDFHNALSDLELGEALGKEKRMSLELDKRQPRDADRSVFLHRLRFLEVPFGELKEQTTNDFATGLLFRERWTLRWDPKIDAALIEKSLYGDTIVAAVLARLREAIVAGDQSADVVCSRLVQSIDMDLPDMVREVQIACSRAIDAEDRFIPLTGALGHLTVIDRYAEHRELPRGTLSDLIVRCFGRACFALADIVAAPEEQQGPIVESLFQLGELILQGKTQGLDRELFIGHVRNAAAETSVPFLRGAFLGILAELRVLSAEDLAAELSALAKAAQDQLVTAGDLLDGIMAASRASILLGAPSLIAAVDELLRSAEWESFLVLLPRMRSAFERLHERQRDRIAEAVAERYGLKEAAAVRELRISPAAAARIAEVDRRVADLMKKWE